jgi:hypothetical protein
MITNDDDTIRALRNAMAIEARGHHLDPEIAATALSRIDPGRRSRRRRLRLYAAVAMTVIVVAAIAVVYSLATTATEPHRRVAPAGTSCAHAVVTSPLPNWARDGFSPNAYVEPHVTGTHDQIIGVLFAKPLRSPPANGHQNKILWVAKDHSAGTLKITARLAGSSQVVTRTIADGPGPSIIDMPAPGCWQLTLTWSGHRDTVSLPYSR